MPAEEKISLLADYLEKQVLDSSLSDGRIWQEMAISQRTFYRLKPKAAIILSNRAKERQKKIAEAKDSDAVEAVRIGLKTKTERLALLQTEIDACVAELSEGKVGGRKLDVYGKVALRKTIKDLQSEISKIEGDYAPIKQTHDAGPSFLDFLKQTSAGGK